MFICAAGDIHGAMDRLYDDVLAFEEALGVRFDCVLHVGDFVLLVTSRLSRARLGASPRHRIASALAQFSSQANEGVS